MPWKMFILDSFLAVTYYHDRDFYRTTVDPDLFVPLSFILSRVIDVQYVEGMKIIM